MARVKAGLDPVARRDPLSVPGSMTSSLKYGVGEGALTYLDLGTWGVSRSQLRDAGPALPLEGVFPRVLQALTALTPTLPTHQPWALSLPCLPPLLAWPAAKPAGGGGSRRRETRS